MNLFGGFVYDACKAAVLRGAEEATGRECYIRTTGILFAQIKYKTIL